MCAAGVDMSDSERESLASLWEKCFTVRCRFRRSLPWLQFPIPVKDVTDGDAAGPHDGEALTEDVDDKPRKRSADPHSPTTRALELNWEVLNAMLDNYNGEFVDVYFLQKEGHEST